jgi:hypothetical protein
MKHDHSAGQISTLRFATMERHATITPTHYDAKPGSSRVLPRHRSIALGK